MAPAGGAELSDVTNSNAFHILDELLKERVLTDAQCELYKSKYAKLHEVVLKTYENEKNLLRKAKEYNQALLNEKLKLEKKSAANAEDASTISNYRNELQKKESEQALGEEREAFLQLQVAELQREKVELTKDLERRERMAAELYEPQIQGLNDAIEELHEEIEKEKKSEVQLKNELRDTGDKIDQTVKETELARQDAAELQQQVYRLRGEPEKIRKQGDVVQNATATLNSGVEKLGEKIHHLDAEAANCMKTRKHIEDERAELSLQLERTKQQITNRDRAADSLKKDLEIARESHNNLLADRVRFDVDLNTVQSDSKRQSDILVRKQREKDFLLRKIKKLMVTVQTSKDQMPPLIRIKEETAKQLDGMKVERKRLSDQVEELKREVDIFINQFLKQELLEKDKGEHVREILKEIGDLEHEVQDLSSGENRKKREIKELTTQREHRAREAGSAINKARETKEDVKVKDLIIMDLTKKDVDTTNRLKEYSQLYELVKNERNKYVNLIQASQQALAEMKEKIKILQNEIEILRNESAAKDKELAKERLEYQSAFQERDFLRAELNKALQTYRERQESVDQQIAEIDRLNSIINATEKDMLRLKKQYEVAVEDRNYTGIQLIDRNDELCILYEKANIQEAILKNGEIEYRKREEEIRMLKLESNELRRAIEVTRKMVPRIPEYEGEVNSLLEELAQERATIDKLSHDLESPENAARWRKLEGNDGDPEELALKIRRLEERLNDKKEHLLEKDLVLEEVTSLADRLRKTAADGRQDTLDLAQKVNEYQGKIRAKTKAMMATVSELSMYQATSMKLQQELQQKEGDLQEARWRLERGEPPTEDAEREWARIVRETFLREQAMEARMAHAQQASMQPQLVTSTTAEPRPTAYIPDDLGIPKPYPALGPFKPTELGANLRHFRMPIEKPIEY
eukprot:Rmarinus@m.15376